MSTGAAFVCRSARWALPEQPCTASTATAHAYLQYPYRFGNFANASTLPSLKIVRPSRAWYKRFWTFLETLSSNPCSSTRCPSRMYRASHIKALEKLSALTFSVDEDSGRAAFQKTSGLAEKQRRHTAGINGKTGRAELLL